MSCENFWPNNSTGGGVGSVDGVESNSMLGGSFQQSRNKFLPVQLFLWM